MLLQVKAKHFKDTNFGSKENCPIAKAFKNQTGLDCYELVDHLRSDG